MKSAVWWWLTFLQYLCALMFAVDAGKERSAACMAISVFMVAFILVDERRHFLSLCLSCPPPQKPEEGGAR